MISARFVIKRSSCELFSRLRKRVGFHSRQADPKEEVAANSGALVEHINVICMGVSGRDHRLLENVTKHQQWNLYSAYTWADCTHLINERRTCVLLLDRGALGTDWKDAIRFVLRNARYCCILLLSGTTQDTFCNDFIEYGGYEVLKTPLEDSDVIEAIRSASAVWESFIERAFGF